MRNSTPDTTPSKVSETGWIGNCALALVAALLIATTAGAIAASSRPRPVTPELWKQATPAFILNLPGGYGVDDNLF